MKISLAESPNLTRRLNSPRFNAFKIVIVLLLLLIVAFEFFRYITLVNNIAFVKHQFEENEAKFTVKMEPETSVVGKKGGKLFCLILTSEKYHKTRAKFVEETWAKNCDGFVFVSDATDPELAGSINFSNDSNYKSIWSKTRSAFEWIHELQMVEFDWFLKADDDSYVVVHRLKRFLSRFDASGHHYFGRRFIGFIADGDMLVPYADGGAAYILSKGAVDELVSTSFKNEKLCAPVDRQVAEDIEIGHCLFSAGIEPVNVVDEKTGCQRFLFWPPWKSADDKQMLKQKYIEDYAEPIVDGKKRWDCSKHAFSFHNVTGNEMKLIKYFVN